MERNVNQAFESAIASGRLSNNTEAANYHGHYMFMGRNVQGHDTFKHRDTREYLPVLASPQRFLLFCGDTYYPSGGWDDLHGTYETLDAAIVQARGDWWHIVDMTTGQIVKNSFDT